MKKIMLLLLLLTVSTTLWSIPPNVFPQIKGWEKKTKLRKFSRETLWDYINGGADVYLKYNFKKLQVAEYTKGEDTYFTAEIYQHASEADAYGIFASERPPSLEAIDIGDRGYFEPGILNFLADQYYIKLRSHSETPATLKAMEKTARGIAENLDIQKGVPDAVACFDEKNREKRPVQYLATNFMGYGFLHSAYKTAYKTDDKSWEAFVISLETKDSCKKMLKDYFAFADKNVDAITPGTYKVKDPYNGDVHLIWRGNNITGIFNAKNMEGIKHKVEELQACIAGKN